jgi:formamidopyrimidine-DNA glycosylase
MPELPEVQCFVDDLNEKYSKKTVAKVVFHRQSIRSKLDLPELRTVLCDDVVLLGFERVGKRLLLITEKGRIAISLGMTGAFVDANPSSPRKHEHITILFSDGAALGFVDPRRFGSWERLPADWKDPAVDGLDSEGLRDLFLSEFIRNSKTPVKSFLLDQKHIGGVGNIYVVEALFRIGVRPSRACSSLSAKDWRALAKVLPELFWESIQAGGSSISTYRRLAGAGGGFQRTHKVYGREGEPCLRRGCSGVIRRVVQAGRSSWYCPRCQK